MKTHKASTKSIGVKRTKELVEATMSVFRHGRKYHDCDRSEKADINMIYKVANPKGEREGFMLGIVMTLTNVRNKLKHYGLDDDAIEKLLINNN